MEVEIVAGGANKKTIATLSNLKPSSTIWDLKKEISKKKPHLYPERQSLRSDARGKSLRDEATLESLNVQNGSQLFLKDLGPQVGWKTVFLVEYTGPLFIYLWFYSRPALIYGSDAAQMPYAQVVNFAAACWAGHYIKRVLETLFIHRFSHTTMPIRNIFKNCSYYWLFAAYVAYYVNHPLYTTPILGRVQEQGGMALFVFFEFGNFSIHLLLRNLRPAGSKKRAIPEPTNWNPLTTLFDFVSCPNYSYEIAAWMAFTFMTQTLPAALFTFAGFYQMTIWALQKHRAYKQEFPNYPTYRTAIIPFIL